MDHFKQFVEAVLHQDKDYIIRDANPDEMPDTFVHYSNAQSVLGIAAHGFNLRKAGSRSRKLLKGTSLEDMYKFDTKGMYVSHHDDNRNESAPYIIFQKKIKKGILVEPTSGMATEYKKVLAQWLGAVGAKARQKLMKMGYDAIISKDKYGLGEIVLMDPSNIKVLKTGNLDLEY